MRHWRVPVVAVTVQGITATHSVQVNAFGSAVRFHPAPDPHFCQTSLHARPRLVHDCWRCAGDYYNTSDSTEVNAFGQPYGFQPRPLPHFVPGFPVVLDNTLSQVQWAVCSTLVRYVCPAVHVSSGTCVCCTGQHTVTGEVGLRSTLVRYMCPAVHVPSGTCDSVAGQHAVAGEAR